MSEFMLQQTRVGAMEGRYRDFVARFPDPDSLARVAEDDAVAAWSGLGYYRRARYLHRAARRIGELGGFPADAASLRALPGVGEYTASAVASIAFAEPVPAVDGNVVRVLSRAFGVTEVRPVAARLMEAGGAADPGRWNQALMELGALVCVARAPRCGECPIAAFCRARATGAFPDPPKRPRPVAVRLAGALVRDRRGRLLLRRPGGMWELPHAECAAGEAPEAALRRIGLRPLEPLASFRHAIMNRRLTVYPFRAALSGPAPPAGRYFRPADIGRIPHGSLVTKTLAAGGYTPAPPP